MQKIILPLVCLSLGACAEMTTPRQMSPAEVIGIAATTAVVASAATQNTNTTIYESSSNHHWHDDWHYHETKPEPSRPNNNPWAKQVKTIGGRCLDISRQVVDGAPLQLWDCNGRINQQFDTRFNEIRIDGKCLDIEGANPNNGARVIAYRCNGQKNQQWDVWGGQIKSRMNGKCLDVTGAQTALRTPVIMWDCKWPQSANQTFTWENRL